MLPLMLTESFHAEGAGYCPLRHLGRTTLSYVALIASVWACGGEKGTEPSKAGPPASLSVVSEEVKQDLLDLSYRCRLWFASSMRREGMFKDRLSTSV